MLQPCELRGEPSPVSANGSCVYRGEDGGSDDHTQSLLMPAVNRMRDDVRPPLDRSAAAIGLVTVVAANFLYLAGLSLILDPMISMEPFYIQMAQRPLLN